MSESVTHGAPEIASPARQAGIAQGVIVVLAGFLPILAIVALAPVVPSMIGKFKDVPGATTLIPLAVTAPGLMIALFAPFMGWLADRHGRRRLLLVATFFYGIVGVAPYFLDDLRMIFASRLALGICEAAILTVTNTLIGDYYAHDQRRTWLAMQGYIGPIFGTSVVAFAGIMAAQSWNAPFLVYAVAFPIFLGMIAFIYEPDVAAKSIDVGRVAEPFPWGKMAVCGAVTLLSSSLYYVYIVQIGLAFGAIGTTAPERVGILISIASIGVFLGAGLFQWLSGRVGSNAQMAVFLALVGAGLIGIGLSGSERFMTAGAFTQQLGAGILIPSLILWTVSQLPAAHRGRGMGIWSGCFFLGQFTSPLFVTASVTLTGTILNAFTLLGILALAGAATATVVQSRTKTETIQLFNRGDAQ